MDARACRTAGEGEEGREEGSEAVCTHRRQEDQEEGAEQERGHQVSHEEEGGSRGDSWGGERIDAETGGAGGEGRGYAKGNQVPERVDA